MLHIALLVVTAAGFKANLFAKDFKKQVLAADALKAWVQDCPEEVRARGLVCPLVWFCDSLDCGLVSVCLGSTLVALRSLCRNLLHLERSCAALQALEPCVASLDLLLRWCVLRLADGNTQTLVSVTGMLKVRGCGPCHVS